MTLPEQVLHLQVELLADTPHRRWNSEKNALTAGGSWDTILFTTVFFNVGYGPWQSAAWAGTLEAARLEMANGRE